MASTMLWLALAGPLGLVAVGLLPEPNTRPHAIARLAFGAALTTLALAAVALVMVAACGPLYTRTLGLGGGGLGLYLDGLGVTMFVLVAFVGAAVIRYSRNYLDGDPNQGVFVQRLCLTVAAVLMLVIAGNLVQLAVAWVATSLGLHKLLLFYPERRAAQLAARKKFVLSRLGDACLIGAAVLLYSAFGGLDYPTLFQGAAVLAASGSDPAAVQAAALLVALAAILRSAQFPLHSWLIEVMETPTPVSALLHAGIINAGGFLVLRLASVMNLSASALDALAVVGAVTALFGSLVMLTQTSTKVSLAFSTVAQMGFMLLQLGLGAFSAALLHMVAHSLYKAHAFLAAGSVIDVLRASWTPSPGGAPHPGRLAIALAAVTAGVLLAGYLLGISPVAGPGGFALGAIVAMSLVLLLANAIDERPSGYVLARAALAAIGVAALYFVLQRAAEHLLAGAVPATRVLRGAFDLAIVVGIVGAFAGITLLQNELARRPALPLLRALYVHLANGLYAGTIANRLALRLWPAPSPATHDRR
ncbi:MAG TPA: proton-conducting transporter membrane subunit [Gammaproteobacteria bacterium]|nr:proton-conducting transporter membrane subunit [Gammaproteobacteria bacterium]